MKAEKLLYNSLVALLLFNFLENEVVMEPAGDRDLKKRELSEEEDGDSSQGIQSGRLIVSPEADVNDIFISVIRAVPGLKEDHAIQGHCTGIPLQMYQKMIDNGRACRHHVDYRCYKACQYEKLGVTKDGVINLKKLMAHFDLFFVGQRPPSIEAIKKAALLCLVKKDNTETLSTTDCERNNVPLECMHNKYYETCRPGETVPQLKHTL